MRRAKTTHAISPKQLKHFAIAAVVLTLLLALVASGQDWGAKAQVQAIEAKNDMVAKEAEKLGTRKIIGGFQSQAHQSQGFGSDTPVGVVAGGGSGGGGGGIQPPAIPQPGALPKPVRPQVKGGRFVPLKPDTASDEEKRIQRGPGTPEQITSLKQVSAERSGATDQGD